MSVHDFSDFLPYKKSLRERALDIDQPLAIYWNVELPEDEDWQNARDIQQMWSGMTKEEEKEVHLQNSLMGKEKIPLPNITEVPDYEKHYDESFVERLQPSYILDPQVPYAGVLDYELDAEDRQWLLRRDGGLSLNPPLSEEELEEAFSDWEFFAVSFPEIELTEDFARKVLVNLKLRERMEPLFHHWQERRKRRRGFRLLPKLLSPEELEPYLVELRNQRRSGRISKGLGSQLSTSSQPDAFQVDRMDMGESKGAKSSASSFTPSGKPPSTSVGEDNGHAESNHEPRSSAMGHPASPRSKKSPAPTNKPGKKRKKELANDLYTFNDLVRIRWDLIFAKRILQLSQAREEHKLNHYKNWIKRFEGFLKMPSGKYQEIAAPFAPSPLSRTRFEEGLESGIDSVVGGVDDVMMEDGDGDLAGQAPVIASKIPNLSNNDFERMITGEWPRLIPDPRRPIAQQQPKIRKRPSGADLGFDLFGDSNPLGEMNSELHTRTTSTDATVGQRGRKRRGLQSRGYSGDVETFEEDYENEGMEYDENDEGAEEDDEDSEFIKKVRNRSKNLGAEDRPASKASAKRSRRAASLSSSTLKLSRSPHEPMSTEPPSLSLSASGIMKPEATRKRKRSEKMDKLEGEPLKKRSRSQSALPPKIKRTQKLSASSEIQKDQQLPVAASDQRTYDESLSDDFSLSDDEEFRYVMPRQLKGTERIPLPLNTLRHYFGSSANLVAAKLANGQWGRWRAGRNQRLLYTSLNDLDTSRQEPSDRFATMTDSRESTNSKNHPNIERSLDSDRQLELETETDLENSLESKRFTKETIKDSPFLSNSEPLPDRSANFDAISNQRLGISPLFCHSLLDSVTSVSSILQLPEPSIRLADIERQILRREETEKLIQARQVLHQHVDQFPDTDSSVSSPSNISDRDQHKSRTQVSYEQSRVLPQRWNHAHNWIYSLSQ